MSFISENLKRIKPSATMVITAKAAQLKREGKKVIGLSSGEPDFDTPKHVKDAAIDAINKGNNEAKVKSKLNTSTANTIAAIGDLNIEATAPAVAHAISSVRVFLSTCNNRLKLELIADPEVIAGPKSPTEPPNPTVSGAIMSGW